MLWGSNQNEMKILMNHHNKLTAPLEKRLPFTVMLCLLVLSAAADAANILQLPYLYRYEVAQDAGESAFVICDDCPVRVPLHLSFKRHVVPPLAVRVSKDISDGQALRKETVAVPGKGRCCRVSEKDKSLKRREEIILPITPPLKSDACEGGKMNEQQTEKERR